MQRLAYAKLICLWTLLLACACTISAQTVSADKLLKQAAQALGGEKAFKAITSVQATGTFTQRSDGHRGKIQIHLQHPNFFSRQQNLTASRRQRLTAANRTCLSLIHI